MAKKSAYRSSVAISKVTGNDTVSIAEAMAQLRAFRAAHPARSVDLPPRSPKAKKGKK